MERLLQATHRAEARHFWFRGLRRFLRLMLDEALPGIPSPRLLDSGCGTGSNLALLAQFGRAVGIDINRTGLRLAARAGRTSIAQASLARAPFPDCSFDVVMSIDVLYCLEGEDEAAALAEMFRVLKPGGAALVNVPALDMLKGDHSLLAMEIRRYTRPRLRAALERAGLRVVRLTYTNAALFPLVAAIRAVQRVLGPGSARNIEREIAVPWPPLNEILAAVLAIEATALRWIDMPIGSSLLCLARRPGEGLGD